MRQIANLIIVVRNENNLKGELIFMANTMFFASYKDAFGKEHANLYFDWSNFYSDTFSPECEIIQLIEFAIHGKNYRERKNSLEEIAVEFSHNAVCGLSYGEIYHIQNFFEIMGKRYGLLREFRENCIC